MPITDPAQLKFIAEGIRPAADRVVGTYEAGLIIINEWDDTDPGQRVKLWPKVKKAAQALWVFYGDSRRLVDSWDWFFASGIPDSEDDVEDGHNKPIRAKHVWRVMEIAKRLPLAFQNNSGALGKAVFAVSTYTAEPADTVALTAVINGMKALVNYLDDDANNNERRIRCRECAVNPQLYRSVDQ